MKRNVYLIYNTVTKDYTTPFYATGEEQLNTMFTNSAQRNPALLDQFDQQVVYECGTVSIDDHAFDMDFLPQTEWKTIRLRRPKIKKA